MPPLKPMFDSLLAISEAAQKWMGPQYGPSALLGSRPKVQKAGKRRSRRKFYAPEYVEFLLVHELHKKALEEIRKTLQLERCAVIRPYSVRTGFWTVVDEIGVPKKILDNSFYSKGDGLTGRVLTGQVVCSRDILADPKHSTRYGNEWINPDGTVDSTGTPRAYVGVPLWMQQTEADTEAVGALYAIRTTEQFSEDEIQFMILAARLISFGHDRLRSWRRRAESDVRQLRLSQIWQSPLSDSYRYNEVLRILKQEFPFPRMLLSLADEAQGRMRGVAAIGFRSDIVSETNRPLAHASWKEHIPPATETCERSEGESIDDKEDILAWVYRKQSSAPQIVSPLDSLWTKVNEITAFRHQVRNSLLLVPLMASSGTVLGVLLAELPNSIQLTPNELNRISLFLNHAAHLIETHRQRLLDRKVTATWKDIHSTLFSSMPLGANHEPIDSVTNVLNRVCVHCGISTAVLYQLDEHDRALRGAAAVGVSDPQFRQHFFVLDSEPALTDTLPLAAAATKRRTPLCKTTDELFDAHGRSSDVSVLKCFNVGSGSCVTAVPTFGPEGCNGVVLFVDRQVNGQCVTQESVSRFASALGHSLSLFQLHHRLERAERSASAFQSLAFAISEIGRGDFVMDGSAIGSVAIRSVLRDTAAMFDAALAQLFLLSTPLDIGDLPKQGVAERLRGTTLRAVAQFLQSQDGVPRHLAGRILKSSPEKRPDIVVGKRKGLTESVLTSLAPVVSSDVESDPFWSNTLLELTGCRSFVGVPLLAVTGKGKALYGVLTMTRLRMDKDDSRAFDVDEVYAVQNVAALILAALVKAQQVELAEAEAERALANEREVRERVGRCLKWFRHDIPGFIAYLEDVVQQHVNEKATPERVLRVANGIRAVYMACAAGLGEVQPGSHQLRKYGLSVDIAEIEVQVRELLKSDWHGKTVVHPFKIDGPKVVDGVSPLALTYVTYALVHNALIACDYNRSVTEPTLPGNVWVEWTSGDGWLELSVADDGGGLLGASWEEMSRESHTMWSTARGIQRNEEPHFGMGLYIVRRLIEGCAEGTVEARDVEHNDGQRVGARFLARVPTGMVSSSESVPEVVGDSQDGGQ